MSYHFSIVLEIDVSDRAIRQAHIAHVTSFARYSRDFASDKTEH